MTRQGYGDGDGRWDIEVICDRCGADIWEPLPDGWTSVFRDDYIIGKASPLAYDYCPPCSKEMKDG